MTKEEAIQILSTRDAHGVLCGYTSGVTEALDMAIEALRAKIDGDLISREDAMGAVQDHFNADGFKGYYDGQKMMDRITALPSAEAEWIPCSERLPQIGTTVITCDDDGDISLDYIIKFGDSSLDFCQNAAYGDCDIIAWMPLPMPYREE